MKSYYECHITLLGQPELIKPHVEDIKWKFSCINGDPVLGEGVKCYATTFYNVKLTESRVLENLNNAAEQLAANGIEVIRRKIEKVIYDSKMEKCDGGCIPCHLDDLVGT